jgi:hypothetical protein
MIDHQEYLLKIAQEAAGHHRSEQVIHAVFGKQEPLT